LDRRLVGEIRYYADEHVSKAVLRGLRQRGIDVLGALEAGLTGVPDQVHLAFAAREGRVLFTQDADFVRLAASNTNHAGLVYAPQRTSIGEVIRGLVLIQQVIEAEEMVGHLEFL
jgi:hypothetical protein